MSSDQTFCRIEGHHAFYSRSDLRSVWFGNSKQHCLESYPLQIFHLRPSLHSGQGANQDERKYTHLQLASRVIELLFHKTIGDKIRFHVPKYHGMLSVLGPMAV